jgi:hypothetical protein
MSRSTKYNSMWEKQKIDGAECGEWLASYPKEPCKAQCTVCNTTFDVAMSGFKAVSSHASGKKHRSNVASRKQCNSLTNYFANKESTTTIHMDSLSDDIIRAELRWSLFFVEHYVSFATAQHSDVVSKMCPDSKIASGMKIGPTKMSYILNDAVCPVFRENILSDLRESGGFYSLSLDESTDVLGCRKFVQLVISFVSTSRRKLMVLPLQTVEVMSGTAEVLERIVVETLRQNQLDLAKCTTLMTDGPSVMTGERRGFLKRMHDNAPHLLQMSTCCLHKISNAVCAACDVLGGQTEDLADNVFAYFHYTSRWACYKEVTSLLEVAEHRFLRRVEIRWVQLLPVVQRLQEQLPALKEYFFNVLPSSRPDDLKTERVQCIRRLLQDETTTLHLNFLASTLPILDKFEKLYQQNEVRIHSMYTDLRSLFRQFLLLFLNNSYVEEHQHRLTHITFESSAFLDENHVFISTANRHILQRIPNGKRVEFFTTVRLFYVKLATKLQTTLPLSDKTLRALRFLDPSKCRHTDEDNIIHLAKLLRFSETDLEQLVFEIRQYKLTSQDADVSQDVVGFWLSIDNNLVQLKRLAKMTLCLPHGNASVERIFGLLSNILSKKRNSLSDTSVDTMITILGYIQGTEQTCNHLPISDSMVKAAREAWKKYKRRLELQREQTEQKKKEDERKRKLQDDIREEMENNKKRQKILEEQTQLANKRKVIENDESLALAMIAEYQKKLCNIAAEKKLLDTKVDDLQKRKSAEEKKTANRTIDKAIRSLNSYQ